MESMYYFQEENGVAKNIYANENYDLTICNNGNVNFDRKASDSNVIINQLIMDLSRTTLKMQTMMMYIETLAKQGFIPTECMEQLSGYIYETENNKPLKK